MSRTRKFQDTHLTPEWVGVRKVSEVARSTVVIVMERNMGKGTMWKAADPMEHIRHAHFRLLRVEHEGLSDIEDIENALCRLAMALVQMKEEQGEAGQ